MEPSNAIIEKFENTMLEDPFLVPVSGFSLFIFPLVHKDARGFSS